MAALNSLNNLADPWIAPICVNVTVGRMCSICQRRCYGTCRCYKVFWVHRAQACKAQTQSTWRAKNEISRRKRQYLRPPVEGAVKSTTHVSEPPHTQTNSIFFQNFFRIPKSNYDQTVSLSLTAVPIRGPQGATILRSGTCLGKPDSALLNAAHLTWRCPPSLPLCYDRRHGEEFRCLSVNRTGACSSRVSGVRRLGRWWRGGSS
jgi:hypothetical protein